MDTNPDKFEQAKRWGATDCVNPKDSDKPIQVRRPSFITPLITTLFARAHVRGRVIAVIALSAAIRPRAAPYLKMCADLRIHWH